MNFHQDDAQVITLEDTFAFLDAFDFKYDTSQLSALEPDTYFTSQPSQYRDTDGCARRRDQEMDDAVASPPIRSQPPLRQQRRRKCIRVSDRPKATSKRPRKQNRLEILKLNEQVEVLEAQLLGLQQRSQQRRFLTLTTAHDAMCEDSGEIPGAASTWLDKAALQYKVRQKAEEVNRKLRASLVSQMRLSKTLEILFQKESSIEVRASLTNRDLLMETEPSKTPNEPQVTDNSPWVPTELYASMEKLHRDTDIALQEIGASNDTNSVFSTCSTKSDVVFGRVFELKSNTPVSGTDFHVLADFFWSHMTSKYKSDALRTSIKREPGSTETFSPRDAHKKHYTMKLQTRLGDVDVKGVTGIRKFEDAHRTVFTFVSTITVSGSDLVFRENGWLVFSKTRQPTANLKVKRKSSLFQTLYRLHVETRESSSMKTDPTSGPGAAADMKYLEELVMDALSNKMRVHQSQMQDLILSGMTNCVL